MNPKARPLREYWLKRFLQTGTKKTYPYPKSSFVNPKNTLRSKNSLSGMAANQAPSSAKVILSSPTDWETWYTLLSDKEESRLDLKTSDAVVWWGDLAYLHSSSGVESLKR
jgi:hypothetical protein